MKAEEIYNLKLFEECWQRNYGYKRVPGGWAMMFYDDVSDTITSSVFIPFNSEFQDMPQSKVKKPIVKI